MADLDTNVNTATLSGVNYVEMDVTLETTDEIIKCEFCNACYNNKADLKKHLKQHRGQRVHKCTECGMNFKTEGQLNIHIKYAQDKPYSCFDCKIQFHCEVPYREHVKAEHGKRARARTGPYNSRGESSLSSSPKKKNHGYYQEASVECDVCGKILSTRANMEIHKRIHTGERPYACEECGKAFSQSGHLTTHMRIHTGEKPYTCNLCGHGFVQAVALKSHMLIHADKRPHQCTVCQKSFRQISHLKIHQRQHTGEKPFNCNECGKSFRQAGSLDVHRKTHDGIRNFQCMFCEKRFKQAAHLNTHLKTHTGEVHKCTQCEETFTKPSALRKHLRSHRPVRGDGKLTTDMKPVSVFYSCDICGLAYTELLALIEHRKSHSHVTKHNCEACTQSFDDLEQLNKHVCQPCEAEGHIICEVCNERFRSMNEIEQHSCHTENPGVDEGVTPKEVYLQIDENNQLVPMPEAGQANVQTSADGQPLQVQQDVQQHHDYVELSQEELKEMYTKVLVFSDGSVVEQDVSGQQVLGVDSDQAFISNEQLNSEQVVDSDQPATIVVHHNPLVEVASIKKEEDKDGVDIVNNNSTDENNADRTGGGDNMTEFTDNDQELVKKNDTDVVENENVEAATTENVEIVNNGDDNTVTTMTNNDSMEEDIENEDTHSANDIINAFDCGICKKSFSILKELTVHLKTHKGFMCDLCPKTFMYQKRLKYHKLKIHGIEEDIISEADIDASLRFICGVCRETFPDCDALDDHLKVHLVDRKSSISVSPSKVEKGGAVKNNFQCGDCWESFADLETLYDHINSHK